MTDAPPQAVIDRASARRFVDTHIAPGAGEFDRTGRVPDDVLDTIGQAGLWAPFLPAEFGGSGLDFVTLGHLHEEVGRGCSSVRSLLTVNAMTAYAVNRWGTAGQRARWLPDLAAGRKLGALCVSEPDAGSDTARMATSATRRADGWVLDGTKTWITGGQRADLFLVFAGTGSATAAFLVPRETAGVRVVPIEDMLGTRAGMLATIRLDDVTVGQDALLGPASFIADVVLTGTLDIGRYSVAAGSIGIVKACLEACADHTTRRHVRGSALREQQLIQAKITNMLTDVTAGRLLYEHAGRLKDAGDPETIMMTCMAKYFAAAAAARHAAEAVQIHGAHGCGPDSPVARHYRDAKVMEIIEGSTEIQQITIAATAYRTPVAS